MGKANPSGGTCRRIPHTIFDMLDKQDCSRYNYDEDPGLVSSPRGPAESMSGARRMAGVSIRKVGKGAWRMPWLTEAMKDAISCDKPR